jgi:hypothetical protein
MGFTAVFLGIVLIIAVAYFVARWRLKKKKEALIHFSCPACRQKLLYRADQAGRRGMCTRCGKQLVFPALPKAPK